MERAVFRLGDILHRSDETTELNANADYREITVRLWGKGVVLRGIVKGRNVLAERRHVARGDQFILSRIDARNGAMGIVPNELDGAILSNDFPVFKVAQDQLVPSYLGWLCKTAAFVDQCRRASEGTTNRIRLKEEKFLEIMISIPSISEQHRSVAAIEHIASELRNAQQIQAQLEEDLGAFLMSAYQQIAKEAARRPMNEVAPLTRRPMNVDQDRSYPQVSVRSFGRGTFHKAPLAGSEITWQKPFLVKTGDILISNIKAWEGAIAVATPQDNDRYGSHRYLTCVPKLGVANARFVCFHLLTPEGLQSLGEASPGTADRNRTLNTKALLRIPIPVPGLEEQQWFDALAGRVDDIRQVQREAQKEMHALLLSTFSQVFAEGAVVSNAHFTRAN